MTTTRRTEVRTYREDLFCDCGGKMEFTGQVLACNPPKRPHKCRICDRVENVRGSSYPRTVYEDVQ